MFRWTALGLGIFLFPSEARATGKIICAGGVSTDLPVGPLDVQSVLAVDCSEPQ